VDLTGITAINNGLVDLRAALVDPTQSFAETGHIRVITFGGGVKDGTLEPIGQFIPPDLEANGNTPFGSALKKLVELAKEDYYFARVEEGLPTGDADYLPSLIIMTDGMPTDEYESGLQEFLGYKRLSGNSPWSFVIAVAAGPRVETSILTRIAPNSTYQMNEMTPDKWRACFKWLAKSTENMAQATITGTQEEAVMPPLPPGMVRVRASVQ
jgi:uncharacterized protein YegL